MSRYRLLPDRSQVWIEGSSSVHPVHATATGLEGFVEVEADADGLHPERGLAGRVAIAVDRLRSGNPLVDRETRRRVDARRHPEITGEVTAVERAEGDRVDLHGAITFRGETCEVAGAVTLAASPPDTVVVEGEQVFDVRRWGLEPPRVLALRVHPEVRVRIHLEGRRDRAARSAADHLDGGAG